ncbi:MAG: hypothetical protein IT340_06180 [Chloroflexi bacterium]|nr:hypothetical protein [Chloroflexota bacterium]
MRRKIVALAAAVAAAGLMAVPAGLLQLGADPATSFLAAAHARAAALQPAGVITKAEWLVSTRLRPDEDRPDPYHRRPSEYMPATLKIVAWLETDASGRTTRSRAQAFDPDGGLVQDALRTPDEALIYDATTGETLATPGGAPGAELAPRDFVRPQVGQDGVAVTGSGSHRGRPTTILSFPIRPIERAHLEAQRSLAFTAPYFADVAATGVRQQIEIFQASQEPVIARAIAVAADGSTTVVRQQELLSVEQPSELPGGLFDGSSVPGKRVSPEPGQVRALPSTRTLTVAEAATALGQRPILPTGAPELRLERVVTAGQRQPLAEVPAARRDLLFAAQRGDAVRFQYGDAAGRVFIIQQGPAAALKAAARQSGATLSSSAPVSFTWERAATGWLLKHTPDQTPGGRAQARLIFEADGLLIDLQGYGFTDSELLTIAAGLRRG